ncbi:MAG: PKD domain-containing protein [Prolixibacteraceae bacterium]|jgi:hypothetical protein
MIPSAANSDYPKFVADQVLTSDNLNDLFGYLDEQGRMTRTNLSGIGIVCGLEVKTSADGNSITITKGVGVTSSGYLASMDEDIIYTKRTTAIFDAVKPEYYNKFVNIASKTQKFNLWELKQEAETEGTTALTKTFLSDGEKIVLIFVELLEENNKNCDPNSCDDKGILVTVNFRPLVIEKANVDDLLNGAGEIASPWLTLPEITMKRFDVLATPMFECLNFFDAYRKILSNSFLSNTQDSLTKAYNVLQPLLSEDFPTNPFASLANHFKFLNDSSITPEQLIVIQYYYDLFSDILLAYSEFRKMGIEFIGMCCPDDMFPRHLLLDLAIPDTTSLTSAYRHYFIPSPILSDQKKTASHLKILFKKLVLLVQKFAVPAPGIKGKDKEVDSNIRITPSVLANIPLSSKSIPYYYAITGSSDDLLKNWSPEKRLQGKVTRNLSYHAKKYNTINEDIFAPLLYDLEPYNFLRIEGHIGKPYTHAVKNITDIRDQNRLPFDIVALSADVSAINSFIKDLGSILTAGTATSQATLQSLIGTNCHFSDLELLFDSIMAELTGKLSNEMKFFYDLKRDGQRKPLPAPNSNVPQVPLLMKTDSTFRFTENSIGHEFELYYQTVKDLPFIPLQVYFQSFGQEGNTDVMDFVFKAVLYYIEMLYETVTTSLSSFTFYNFYIRYYTLIQAVRYIKLLNKLLSERFPLSEEENDHLDALLSISADGRMLQLYMEFLRRILQVKIMQQAGFYFNSNPGIQHKAGVPMGGTFIMVYHETDKTQTVNPNAITNNSFAFKADAAESRSSAATATTTTEKVIAEASTTDHLRVLSSGVNEKVLVAKDKIITGLRKTINTNTITAEKATNNTATIDAKESGTNNLAAAPTATASSKTDTSQDINQQILAYLTDAATYLKNRKADQLDEAIADFSDGVVIADFYLPYLCCSDCPPIQITVVGQTQPNQPPVARPGDNVSVQLPVNSVTLDGSTSSDPDGTIKTYLWELQSGSEATIENPSEAKTVVSKLSEGNYVFKLTVTDDQGTTDSDTVTVTVLPLSNVPPVAVAFAEPNVVTLSANGSGVSQLSGVESKDPDGEIKSFGWSLSSGPTGGAIINNPDLEKTLVTFTQPGNYVFKLIVTDDKGASDTTAVTVTVTDTQQNLPPVAKASANPATIVFSPDVPQVSQLDSNGSVDPDGTIVSFNWSLSSGPTGGVVITTPDKPVTTTSFAQVGIYVFKLTVTDDKGASDSTSVTVTVTESNQGPVAKAAASPSTIIFSPLVVNLSQLDSNGSVDPDGTIVSFNWSLSSGPTGGAVINTPDKPVTTVSFAQVGIYVFQLTVTDDKGATASATATVTVNASTNQPPVASAVAVPTSVVMIPGQATTAQLDGSNSSDPNGNIKSFQWSLVSTSGGAQIVSPNAAKTVVQFTQAGTFKFDLTVTDDAGLAGSASASVTVTQEIVTLKTCALLNNIITDFDKIQGADTPANFKLFTARYPDIREITAFFNLMKSSNIVDQPVDAQIKFFIEQKTEAQLVKWIDNLNLFMLELPDLRLLALLTLNVLSQLSYFISCIQPEDVNKSKVKMVNALTSYAKLLQMLLQVALSLPTDQRGVLATMNTNARDERTRVKSNGDESAKPTYVEILTTILGNFKAMNL